MTGRRDVSCLLLVVATALVLLAPSTVGKGSAMDEGAVVAYASRVPSGAIPYRDYETFYGPANVWLVAGAFEAFGQTVSSERAIGLLYRLVIVVALFVIGRSLAGVVAGALAGVLSAAMMANELVWAAATWGSLAFGLTSIALCLVGARRGPSSRRTVWFLLAGVVGGLAVLMRFDFLPGVVLASLPLLAYVGKRARLAWSVGLVLLVMVYLPLLALAGARLSRFIDDLNATRAGRTLPLPSPLEFPGSLLVAAAIASVLFVALGVVLWRRDRTDVNARLLVSVGLFSLALGRWVLWRPDVFHIRPVALVSLSLVPGVVVLVVRLSGLSHRGEVVLSGLLCVVALAACVNQGALARLHSIPDVRGGYRGFFAGRDDPARLVTMHARALVRPGASVFAGPRDLRRTNYGPTYIYFLLPQARPASYYMEMNPKTANREGSGLADDLRGAEWLILTSDWDGFKEPNESSDYGPAEPNRVVANDFCLRYQRGTYGLYKRCDRGGASRGG
jgi:hypothetical protein